MKSNQVRQEFLSFFESKGHKVVSSAPIVIKNDPTLLFTNAGMNQFKDWFLGNETPKFKRVANTQKCLRVSGKHNDLEEVGVDTYHHTMFEMLGNWSFGDYFKKETIAWAWELLTEVYKLDKNRLYVTVFEGDKKDNLEFDAEAFENWKYLIDPNRILNGNKKDNFWEMGDTGPCGPCSEIHFDLRSDEERKKVDGKDLVNNDHPQVIEIWNLVFMEFNRKADGSLEKLPAKHVDTGMGFERLCRVIDGKSSNYDTDIFMAYINFIEAHTGIKYGFADSKTDIAMRVLADHVRAISFAIADGQLPSNTGAGYVIRRILRRAVRYAYQFLGIKEPFIEKLSLLCSDNFKDVFGELFKQKDFVARVIKEEEQSFLRTLDRGLGMLSDLIAKNRKGDISNTSSFVLPGTEAFELFDTYGFPLDLTQLIVRENNGSVDVAGFDEELKKQKDRSRKATEIAAGDWVLVAKDGICEFVGYDFTEAEVRIIKYRKVKAKSKEQYQIVFDKTPFYPEGGGQVGDKGKLICVNSEIVIVDTLKENNLIIHITDKLPQNLETAFVASVDVSKRKLTECNHTATHLLHAALRQVLGKHVQQKGSLVNSEYLRFDFSHFSAMTSTEIAAVEKIVNEKIRQNIVIDDQRQVPISIAQEMGAMMLFGEKYGDNVRVVTFDSEFSRELCGGTHVNASGQIGLFKITSESAVAAGVRRIEAITSNYAEQFVNDKLDMLEAVNQLLKTKDPLKTIKQVLEEKQILQKNLEKYEAEKIQDIKAVLKDKIQFNDGINLLVEFIDAPSVEQLKNLCFQLRGEYENLFCVFGTVINDKPFISVAISDDLVSSKKLNASNIVKELAKEIGGNGGGQPFYATAGGTDTSGIQKALNKAKDSI